MSRLESEEVGADRLLKYVTLVLFDRSPNNKMETYRRISWHL